MSLEIAPLAENHLEQAAKLVRERYQGLLEQVPLLPARYGEIETLLPLLQNITQSGPACAAMENGRLEGFLAARLLPSFRGTRAAFSPEWANAARLPDSRSIYEAMYADLAATWVAQDFDTHLISLLPNDRQGLECWQWLGFGMIAADAVRGLEYVPESESPVTVRRAELRDIEQVVRLNQMLRQHTAGAPIFLVENEAHPCKYYEQVLEKPDSAIWLADLGAELVAYLELGPANDDACTIICDAGTSSITEAFTEAQVRGEGIATALLNRALGWAAAQGYVRCAVDFEPMNYWARRFWLRYFQPVSYTLVRHI